jgi:hypothetical protein
VPVHLFADIKADPAPAIPSYHQASYKSDLEPLPLSLSVAETDVPKCELRGDQWIFTIQLMLTDSRTTVLFRTYDDIWALHIGILHHFPDESGYENQPRIVPFLPQPRKLVAEEAQNTRHILVFYLATIFSLPPTILDSPHLAKFFTPRQNAGDLMTAIPLVFDASDALLDLIDDMQDHMVRITLHLDDRNNVVFNESSEITYTGLMRVVQARARHRVREILYKDEASTLILLYDDADLRLLFQLEEVTLFVR